MLAYTQASGAQIAFMNPGGIRADLVFRHLPGRRGRPGQVTYGEAFTVQPFNNLVVTLTYTGAQLKDVLEQQFAGYAGQTVTKFLQVSNGFTYSYDTTRPLGSRVSALALNGTPIDPAATYRVTTNDFVANGGDGFTLMTGGTDRTTAPGFDVDALAAYLATGTDRSRPGEPDHQDRLSQEALHPQAARGAADGECRGHTAARSDANSERAATFPQVDSRSTDLTPRRAMDGPCQPTAQGWCAHDQSHATLGIGVRLERRPDRAPRQHARHGHHAGRREEVRRHRDHGRGRRRHQVVPQRRDRLQRGDRSAAAAAHLAPVTQIPASLEGVD